MNNTRPLSSESMGHLRTYLHKTKKTSQTKTDPFSCTAVTKSEAFLCTSEGVMISERLNTVRISSIKVSKAVRLTGKEDVNAEGPPSTLSSKEFNSSTASSPMYSSGL